MAKPVPREHQNVGSAPGTPWARAQGCGDGVFVSWGRSAPAGNVVWHCQHLLIPHSYCLGCCERAGANPGMNLLQQLISRAAAISSAGALPSSSSSPRAGPSPRGSCPALLPPWASPAPWQGRLVLVSSCPFVSRGV